MRLTEKQTERVAAIILQMHELQTELKQCQRSPDELAVLSELGRAGIHMGRFLRGGTFGPAALDRHCQPEPGGPGEGGQDHEH